MKIAHVSDIHIRNLKYHGDYRKVFENLYSKLRELEPDIIVNTGDTAHTKTQISPEFVEMTSEHIRKCSAIAPYHIILGNHDLNLMNSDRQDAITPIVESIGDPRVHLYKKSGLRPIHDVQFGFNFWVFGIGDQENYPKPEDWARYPDDVNIGLFHGSVLNCITDSNWRMTHTEQELSLFDGLDYVLMGDIHKQQFMCPGRNIGYAGSLIQQNFGEDVDKGFLFWEIEDKENFRVTPVHLTGSRSFITLDLNLDKTLPKIEIPEDSRVRIRPKCPLTLVEQKAIERQVKKKFKPHDVITLSIANIGQSRSSIGKESVAHENLRRLDVQERLLRRFLSDKGLTEKVLSKVIDLNRKFHIEIEQRDEAARNVFWRIKRLGWSNLFNYGENNSIDFSTIGGLTGIFAPNAAGKSNMIDVIMQTLFDNTTKGITKNIHLINDNKSMAIAIAELEAEDQEYILERTIERIKYGQKSGPTKEWGKTAVNFYGVDASGVKDSLNGVSRPETERAVRKRVGTFDDFMLSNLFAQWNPSDVIQCKETERKRILYRFLDLDIFEQKGELGKKDAKELYDRLRDLEDSHLDQAIVAYRTKIAELSDQIERVQRTIEMSKDRIAILDEQIVTTSSKKVKVDCDVDGRSEEMRVVSIGKEITKLKSEHAQKSASILQCDEELLTLRPLYLTDAEEVLKERSAERITEIDTKIATLHTGRASLEKDSTNSRKNLQLLEEVPCGDMFPQCKFLVNAFEGKKSLPLFVSKIEKAELMIVELQEERGRLLDDELQLREHRTAKQKQAVIRSKRENLKLQLENINLKLKAKQDELKLTEDRIGLYAQAADMIKKNREISELVEDLKSKKQKSVSDLEEAQEELGDLHVKLGSEKGILSKIEEQQAQLNDLRDLCSAYEHYITAMGKDGIAFDILKQKLPLINEEINKILSSCADFNVHVEHDPEEESIRIYIQYGEYRSRLIELGSGAEKFLSSIALRNALLNISNLPKTNLFVIDEGFGKLDPKNMENINRMFDYLRTVFDHIIVISHSDIMKDFVDNMIEITTDEEGYAHVEVG